MEKIRRSLFLVILLFALTQNIFSQTADEIIDNYVNAMGGTDKLMDLKTVKFTGKFSGGGVDVPTTIVLKRDGKVKMEMTYQGMNLINASDGSTAWSVNPFNGNKEAVKLPAEELKEMKKTAEIEGELVNYKQKGYKVDFLGKDDFEGSEVYKIKLVDKDGDVNYYFLDVSNYLILKKSTKRKIKEKEIKSETIFGNYQKFNDIMFPMSYEIRQAGSDRGQTIIIDKVEINVNVDDGIFKMPLQ